MDLHARMQAASARVDDIQAQLQAVLAGEELAAVKADLDRLIADLQALLTPDTA